MANQELVAQLASLVDENRALELRISDLEDQVTQSMISDGETKIEHGGYQFIRVSSKEVRRVDYREFYALASQHDQIPSNVLEEIASQCAPTKTLAGYLQVRRIRGGG